MTIYSQISRNKIRSFAILGIFIVICTGFFYIIGQYSSSSGSYLILGLLFSLGSTGVSYFLSDKIILFTTGAHHAKKERYFNFYTVCENLSIASGLPMPSLYVIDDPAPNAFATGRNPKHAVVCVTTGLLEKLERVELEAVVAHELSHVKNYDILLASVVAVLVGTIAMVSSWITRSMWWGGFRSRDNDNDRGRNPIMFVLLIVALIITPIVATLIQLAISRKREYLADANGVLLTRYPEGLARALEKIASDRNVLHTASPATAHLFITNPLKGEGFGKKISSLFSTHPPIEERIKILRKM